MSSIKDLKKSFKSRLATDSLTLEKYSHDASLFEIKPSAVVFPKNAEEIKDLVTFVEKAKLGGDNISITARAAGTDMTGAAIGQSIILDTNRYMNKVIKVGANYAIAEPGILYRDFEKITLKNDLLLPSYPASRELCALGGMVANNSGGEKTLVYGKTENYVREIKMVLKDGNEYTFGPLDKNQLESKKNQNNFEGEVYRRMSELVFQNQDLLKEAKPKVSKNSAGYYLWNIYDEKKDIFDLSKLITGSQGTLGIITQVKVGLVKPKPYSRLLIIFLKDLRPLADITESVLKFKPESFESYDNNTFRVALRLVPQIIKKLKGNAIKLFFSFLPEFWMAASGGLPKLVLLAEFTADNPLEAYKKAASAQKGIKTFGLKTKVIRSEEEAQKYWTIRRESFNLLRHYVSGMRTAPFIDDFTVRPEQLSEFLPKLYAILGQYDLLYTISGHVGDGNFHIIPLVKMDTPGIKEVIKNLGEKVYKLVLDFGGSITAEHNDGLIRGPYLEMMYGKKVYELFQETKKIFDPDGIFNPGKKVNTSWRYAMEYMDLDGK